VFDCSARMAGGGRFYCVQSWNANGIAWIIGSRFATLDAINRGSIRGEDIASKTDSARDR
jgi:hypothetical protein